jgi:peroxiredoxin
MTLWFHEFIVLEILMYRLKSLFNLLIFCGLLCPMLSVTADPVDFELTGLDGKQYRLSDYRGKWVLVNYWATWCPPCQDELPELEIFYNNYKDQNAVVLGVAMERIDQKWLKAFVDEQFLSYPILMTKPAARTELGEIPGLPTSFLVNPKGELVARRVGPITLDELESFFENKISE